MRQMVGQRKSFSTSQDDSSNTPDARDPGADDSDAVTCPNCDCKFDEETMNVITPGKPVAGADGQGPDLGALGSAPPVPGPMGTAADASRGEQAMTNLLASLKGKV